MAEYQVPTIGQTRMSQTGQEYTGNVNKTYHIFYESTQQFRTFLAGPGATLDRPTWLTFELWIGYMESQIRRMLGDWQETENNHLVEFGPKHQVHLSKNDEAQSAASKDAFKYQVHLSKNDEYVLAVHTCHVCIHVFTCKQYVYKRVHLVYVHTQTHTHTHTHTHAAALAAVSILCQVCFNEYNIYNYHIH